MQLFLHFLNIKSFEPNFQKKLCPMNQMEQHKTVHKNLLIFKKLFSKNIDSN